MKALDIANSSVANLPDDDKIKFYKRRGESIRQTASKLTLEQKKILNSKISAGVRNYFDNNYTEDDAIARKERMKKFWSEISDKEYDKIRQKDREAWFNHPKEVQELRMKTLWLSRDKYFRNASKEEKDKWRSKWIESMKEYFQNTPLEGNELVFRNILNSAGIRNDHHWFNQIKHQDFDKVFTYNPLTGSDYFSAYHCWDFIVYTSTKTVLIDVDGSIHDPNGSNSPIMTHSSKKFKLKEFIMLNDSKRPYQTDGLDAYVIQCYDDNIIDNTPVVKIGTNEITNVLGLLGLLKSYDMTDEELNNLINISKGGILT